MHAGRRTVNRFEKKRSHSLSSIGHDGPRDLTKCANFRGSPLFRSCVQHKNKQTIHLLICCAGGLDASGRKRVLSFRQHSSIKLAKDNCVCVFCVVRSFEKEDFLENSPILSCLVQLKNVLFVRFVSLAFLIFLFFFFRTPAVNYVLDFFVVVVFFVFFLERERERERERDLSKKYF